MFSVRHKLRPKKELGKTVLYEARAEVEDALEHDCVLCETQAEAEERVE